MGLGLAVHPTSGITDHQHHVRAGMKVQTMVPLEALGEVDIADLDRQPTAILHGISSIDDQVHDDLFELGGSAFTRPSAWSGTMVTAICSPACVWSVGSIVATSLLRSNTIGCRICRQLKARS